MEAAACSRPGNRHGERLTMCGIAGLFMYSEMAGSRRETLEHLIRPLRHQPLSSDGK